VVVLSAIEWHILRDSLPVIRAAIEVATPGSVRAIEVGTFKRKPAG
jgi:hypothetical protein